MDTSAHLHTPPHSLAIIPAPSTPSIRWIMDPRFHQQQTLDVVVMCPLPFSNCETHYPLGIKNESESVATDATTNIAPIVSKVIHLVY